MKAWFSGHRISEISLSGENSFSLLRLLSALAVLFDHSFLLLDKSSQIYPNPRYADASAVGVWSFFFISGFLVTRSWVTRKSAVSFLASRSLRIFPALWLVLFFTVFVLGPSLTTVASSEFFSRPETWNYLLHNFFLQVELTLPGVFFTGQSDGPVNQSLWTLPYEIQMYILVCLIGWLFGLSESIFSSAWRRYLYEAALILAFALLLGNPKQGLLLPVVMDMLTLPLLASFAAGAIAYGLRDRIPLRLDVAMLLLLYLVNMPTTNTSRIALLCAWWYLLLVIAFYPFPLLLSWSKTLDRHDFSYGLYLSGFPIQQVLITYVTTEPWSLLALSLTCSLAWAATSWHFVEKPCLSLKRYLKHP